MSDPGDPTGADDAGSPTGANDAYDADDLDNPDRPTLRGLASRLVTGVRARPPAEFALVYLLAPLLLITVAAIPGSDAWQFPLSAEGVFAGRATLWTAFASSFVHTSTTHLVDNVVNYWLVMAVAYPLTLLAGWRRRLLYAAIAYVAVVPVLSAWATLYALGDLTNAPAAGFSDLNNAFLGYLLVVWFAALARESRAMDGWRGSARGSPGVDPRWALVAALGSLAVVFAVPSGVAYFPPLPGVAVAFALGAVLVAAALVGRTGWPRLAGLGLDPPRELLYVAGASVLVAGIVGSLAVVPFGSNVYAHLVGYVVGVTVPLLGMVVEWDRKNGEGTD